MNTTTGILTLTNEVKRPWLLLPKHRGGSTSTVLWLTDEQALARLERVADVRPLLGTERLLADLAASGVDAIA